MDRNTITGLLLIGAIMIGYFLWMSPSQEEREAQQRKQDSIANAQVEESRRKAEEQSRQRETQDSISAIEAGLDSATRAGLDSTRQAKAQAEYGALATAMSGEAAYHAIGNDVLKLTLSSKGAAPVLAQLTEYSTYDSLPLYLFDKETSEFSFSFWLNKAREVRSSELYFEPVASEMTASQAVYRLYGDSREQYIEVFYRIPEDGSYMVDAGIRSVGMEQVMNASEHVFELDWQIMAPLHEKSREQQQRKTTTYYKYMDEDPDYISEQDYEEENLEAMVHWVAFKEQFFSAAIIAPSGFSKEGASVSTTEVNDYKYTKGLGTSLSIPFADTKDPSFDFQFYFGPNHYQTLNHLDIGLEDQIDLGWAIFGWVNRWLVIPTFNFLDEYTGVGYGIIILLLTILIKIILFPLTWRNYVSSARMRVLKPEVDEINEKMKDKDPMQKQQAVMALYRQAGVNPLAGCVPMLLQIPILYAMFQFFPASIELRQEAFLWAEDLSTYDSVLNLPFEIPFYGSHVSLFTLLMAISTFFYSKYNMDMTGGTNAQMPQMKLMIYLMPFMLLFFFNSYSAGLSYYYLSANVISMLQQFAIKKWFIDEDAIHQKIQDNKRKPVKKSGFQKRLEKMAKERGYQLPKK